jgi:hypothetical protein
MNRRQQAPWLVRTGAGLALFLAGAGAGAVSVSSNQQVTNIYQSPGCGQLAK